MILKTELMPHQKAAFDKVSRHKVGALFMEMGTGKSRVAIELIHFYRKRGIKRCLWVCPVNTKHNIASEISKHSGGLDVHVFDDKPHQKDADVYIIGTESISQSDRAYLEFVELIDDSLVIVDESHDFKTPGSKRTKRLLLNAPKAAARYVMTGTPMTRGFEDLYCQFHFLSPKILGYGNFNQFAHYHLEFDPVRKGRISRRKYSNYVTTKIAPYVYQVKKEECLNLPKKTYSFSTFELPGWHGRLYEEVKNEILDSAEFIQCETGVMIYKLFSTLQRMACGVKSIDDEYEDLYPNALDNPRIKDLLWHINRIPNDEQVIVWAKYTHDINSIRRAIVSTCGEDSVVTLNGELTQKERDENIKKFRGGARFLVANPSTGGIGLTLNEASYVIFYSQTFKYVERMQAEDRCHRIGQDKNVHYITIESKTGIDQMISSVLSRRGNAVEDFKQEVDAIKKMTDKKQAEKAIKKLREKL